MYYSPAQKEIDTVRQRAKNVFVKVELLNKKYKILDTLSGSLLSDSMNIDGESKQRRIYSCTFQVSDQSLLTGNDKKIWIDKYLRVHYGVENVRTGETVWWLIGTFTYVDTAYSYSASENTISLKCADLMCDYDGTKNGVISGPSITIPAGEDIRCSVIALLKEAGITKYMVEDIKKEIPYDLEFKDSATYCDILTDICELYDSWEFFFDVDGTFIWRQIPTGYSQPPVLDDVLLQPLLVSESMSNSFKDIYNVTEVWGKVFELSNNDRYTDTSVFQDGVYQISIDGIGGPEDLDHLDKIAIKICADNPDEPMISINESEAVPVVNEDGSPIKKDRMAAGATYLFQFRRNLNDRNQDSLYLLGQYQAHGIYKEGNEDCPFSVGNLGYEIVRSFHYDKLYSDDLCYNQAEYLTYQSTALRDTVTLSVVIIPWLDANLKISYTSQITKKTEQYMIKNISWSTLDGTMTMTLYKFLESFSYVKNREARRERRNH